MLYCDAKHSDILWALVEFFVTCYVISFLPKRSTQLKKIKQLYIINFTIDVHILTKKSKIGKFFISKV